MIEQGCIFLPSLQQIRWLNRFLHNFHGRDKPKNKYTLYRVLWFSSKNLYLTWIFHLVKLRKENFDIFHKISISWKSLLETLNKFSLFPTDIYKEISYKQTCNSVYVISPKTLVEVHGVKSAEFHAKKLVFTRNFIVLFYLQKTADEADRILVEAIMFCNKQHAEIGLHVSKIMIFILKIRNALANRNRLKTKNWSHYF